MAQYEQLAKHFNPQPNAARDWAKLAKRAGQKYMVMTTKHHEGFCNLDTKLTNYCAPKQGVRPRPGGGIRGSRARRGPARGLLLLADGLAPSRRRPLRDRRGGARALCGIHARPDPRTADQLRKDRRSLVRRRLAAHARNSGNPRR